MINPYESPTTAPESAPRGTWRKRFRPLCIRSILVTALSIALGQAIEHAMPDEPGDTYVLVRALVGLITLISMAAIGLFGIGWVISPQAARVELGP